MSDDLEPGIHACQQTGSTWTIADVRADGGVETATFAARAEMTRAEVIAGYLAARDGPGDETGDETGAETGDGPGDGQARAAAERERAIAGAIDAHVEATARARQYNSAAHLAGYVASSVPAWAAEAAAFVAWRDAVWLAACQMLAEVQAAEREAPTPAAAIAELPAINWPG